MPELTRRYVVMTMAAAAPFDLGDPDAPFVLKPWKDPAALAALRTYRDHAYPELARELDEWIRVIEAGPVVRGDVGRRNEAHAAARAAASPASRPRGEGARGRAANASRPARAGAAKKRVSPGAGRPAVGRRKKRR